MNIPYFLWKNCADDSLVDKIKDIGESLTSLDGEIEFNGHVNKEIRSSVLSWIPANEISKEIYKFFRNKISGVNSWYFKMPLNRMEEIQYTRYPIGGLYKKHNDIRETDLDERRLSVILSLSDESEYQGGDFLIYDRAGAIEKSLRFNKGDLIIFPSYVHHEVTPVTSGTRITAVAWFRGPKL